MKDLIELEKRKWNVLFRNRKKKDYRLLEQNELYLFPPFSSSSSSSTEIKEQENENQNEKIGEEEEENEEIKIRYVSS